MKHLYFILLASLIIFGCIDEPEIIQEKDSPNEYAAFDFKNTSTTDITVSLHDSDGAPFNGIKTTLWRVVNDQPSEVIFTAFTDANGEINSAIDLSNIIDRVIIQTNTIGIPNNILVPVENNNILFVLTDGEITSNVIEDDGSGASSVSSPGYFANVVAAQDGVVVNYLGDYTWWYGVPRYLEKKRDKISKELLEYVNASLPEGQPVPEYHPTYLSNTKRSTLEVVEKSDVWVTFVHEGAEFRNAIAFYTYPTGKTPQNIEEVGEVTVIFPNLSYKRSGGGLKSGHKVNIGQFEPGTTIGLVMMSDAWNGRDSENPTWMFYGDKHLNPEQNGDLQQHNVLLWDAENELFLVGFEDVKRTESWCDHDFNDAILYVTSNPVEGLSTLNVSPVDQPDIEDSDGDGINDPLDEYPNDPNKAYDTYYPSPTAYGTFAFEDNWPGFGDYDFNDLVIDYQFKHTLNANNEIVSMHPKFKIRAIGAGFRNGFGFATDLVPGDVVSVHGASTNSTVKIAGNGVEANQRNAVFIVTSNVHDHFATNGFVNTKDEDPFYEPYDIILDIEFATPKAHEQIGSVPYNPFIYINQERGREVHLPGYRPTDLLDQDYLGTQDDDSDPGLGIYYKSKSDLPWGIHLPESFVYPKERSDVRNGHLRFHDWARSSGFSYMDWYTEQSGYRNTSHLYVRF